MPKALSSGCFPETSDEVVLVVEVHMDEDQIYHVTQDEEYFHFLYISIGFHAVNGNWADLSHWYVLS